MSIMGKLLKTAGSIASPMASLTKSAIKTVSHNAKEELVGLPYNQEGNPHPSLKQKMQEKQYKTVKGFVDKILGVENKQEPLNEDKFNRQEQIQKQSTPQSVKLKPIDLTKDMPNLYRNMQKKKIKNSLINKKKRYSI